ncbi:hypothetical protein LVD15_22255 [Fulvivirga maritima]|uniref:hypothetical protein n=1 Tax=Fulvivirga maritima TaxID=2904247 RepID=UPI001F48581D|nr:hypothetical protein [Fulvivirga maritima]UII25998.1 hypothetical protein LVD15_22255 [Fulvivirga maritima]
MNSEIIKEIKYNIFKESFSKKVKVKSWSAFEEPITWKNVTFNKNDIFTLIMKREIESELSSSIGKIYVFAVGLTLEDLKEDLPKGYLVSYYVDNINVENEFIWML